MKTTAFFLSLVLLSATSQFNACGPRVRTFLVKTLQIQIVLQKTRESAEVFNRNGFVSADGLREIYEVLYELGVHNSSLIDEAARATEVTGELRVKFIKTLSYMVDAASRLKTSGALHIKNADSLTAFDNLVASIKILIVSLQALAV